MSRIDIRDLIDEAVCKLLDAQERGERHFDTEQWRTLDESIERLREIVDALSMGDDE